MYKQYTKQETAGLLFVVYTYMKSRVTAEKYDRYYIVVMSGER